MILHNNAPTFWRRILLTAEQGNARGEIMDNVHHFIVNLEHDGKTITAAGGEGVRVPWTTCSNAPSQLGSLIATPVTPRGRVEVDQFQQCTHMLDTAKLAIAQIARGGTRTYDMLVQNGDGPDSYRASIARDGNPLFEWMLRRDLVIAPDAFAGHMVRGRVEWPEQILSDPDLREATLILRRCVFVFRSRPSSKSVIYARDMPSMRDACFSFQSTRVDAAMRPADFREFEI